MKKLMHWWDLETGNAHHSTQALQFACVTTDQDLNVIEGSETNLLSTPRMDMIPSPIAFMIHMLDIDHLKAQGMPERELVETIRNRFLFSENSQSCGYNTIKFDDHVLRHSLFRNFLPAYDHEWRNGNSRFDAFKYIQLIYALRPEILIFPKKEDGSDSLKLEGLSKANGIEHLRAHDALSDVYATIDLVRIAKERNPRLYDWAQGLTNKQNNEKLANGGGPLIHVHFGYGKENRNSTILLPLVKDLSNKNKYIGIDLRVDPYNLLNMTPEEIRYYRFTKRAELPENAPVVPVQNFQINDMPIIAPATKGLLTQELCDRNNFDLDLMNKHREMIEGCRDLKTRLQKAFKPEPQKIYHVFDSLYPGDFFSKPDAGFVSTIGSKTQDEINGLDSIDAASKTDDKPRLLELLVAMKSADSLNLIEKAILHRRLGHSFNDSESKMTFDQFNADVQKIRVEMSLSDDQEIVLQKLIAHVDELKEAYVDLDAYVSEHRESIDKAVQDKELHWLSAYMASEVPNGVMPKIPFRNDLAPSGPSM